MCVGVGGRRGEGWHVQAQVQECAQECFPTCVGTYVHDSHPAVPTRLLSPFWPESPGMEASTSEELPPRLPLTYTVLSLRGACARTDAAASGGGGRACVHMEESNHRSASTGTLLGVCLCCR